MSARSVGDELCRVERAALAQLVENVQRADALLAELEREVPELAGRVARIRVELYRLPPEIEATGGGKVLRLPRATADDELARAWGEIDDKGDTEC